MKNTSKDMAAILRNNGAKVRYQYDRYPTARINQDFKIFGDYYGFPVLSNPEDFLLVGKELRPLSELKEAGIEPHKNGGRVTVTVTTKSGEEFTASAQCRIEELFDKELGKRIALGRVLAEISK